MEHGGGSSGLGMALQMLVHMPWYHYGLMVAVVVAAGIVVHLRIRRRYWPQHATMSGVTRTTVEHLFILVGVEVVGVIVAVVATGAGMIAYHGLVPMV